jgi:hypothetical protein
LRAIKTAATMETAEMDPFRFLLVFLNIGQ